MRKVAEDNLAEINVLVSNYLESKDQLEPISRDELLKRVKAGEVTLIDVRPETEYVSGHLPKAMNIPLSNIKKQLSTLPRNKEVIAYCRGPYCVLAYDAIQMLRTHGFNARRLEDGFPEWKLQGLPVEQ